MAPWHTYPEAQSPFTRLGMDFEAARVGDSEWQKIYYGEGDSFLEIPDGTIYVVGNDTGETAITFHVQTRTRNGHFRPR